MVDLSSKFFRISGRGGRVKTLENYLQKDIENKINQEVLDKSLIAASKAGHEHIIEFLIEKGADPSYDNNKAFKNSIVNGNLNSVIEMLATEKIKDDFIAEFVDMYLEYYKYIIYNRNRSLEAISWAEPIINFGRFMFGRRYRTAELIFVDNEIIDVLRNHKLYITINNLLQSNYLDHEFKEVFDKVMKSNFRYGKEIMIEVSRDFIKKMHVLGRIFPSDISKKILRS